jgi:hypothetical protein
VYDKILNVPIPSFSWQVQDLMSKFIYVHKRYNICSPTQIVCFGNQSIMESRGLTIAPRPQAITLVACNKNYPPSPNKIIDFWEIFVVLIPPLQT